MPLYIFTWHDSGREKGNLTVSCARRQDQGKKRDWPWQRPGFRYRFARKRKRYFLKCRYNTFETCDATNVFSHLTLSPVPTSVAVDVIALAVFISVATTAFVAVVANRRQASHFMGAVLERHSFCLYVRADVCAMQSYLFINIPCDRIEMRLVITANFFSLLSSFLRSSGLETSNQVNQNQPGPLRFPDTVWSN